MWGLLVQCSTSSKWIRKIEIRKVELKRLKLILPINRHASMIRWWWPIFWATRSILTNYNWVDSSIYKLCIWCIPNYNNKKLNCPYCKLIKPGNSNVLSKKTPQNWGVIKQFLPDYHLVKTANFPALVIRLEINRVQWTTSFTALKFTVGTKIRFSCSFLKKPLSVVGLLLSNLPPVRAKRRQTEQRRARTRLRNSDNKTRRWGGAHL